MKYFNLLPEEQEIEEALKKGRLKLVRNQKTELKKARLAAAATMAKTRNINLRLSEKTVIKLKAKAVEEGIPYQTLASSVLHKFANS